MNIVLGVEGQCMKSVEHTVRKNYVQAQTRQILCRVSRQKSIFWCQKKPPELVETRKNILYSFNSLSSVYLNLMKCLSLYNMNVLQHHE